MKLYSNKTDANGTKRVTLCGIRIYKKWKSGNSVKRAYLGGVFKTKSNYAYKKMYVFGIRIHKTILFENVINNLMKNKYQECVIEEARNALIVFNQHQKVFPRFKGINRGKSLAIVGSGPSLNLYRPLQNVKHIALNRSFLYDKVKFDYLFSVDYRGIKNYADKLLKYDCIKFMGQYIDKTIPSEMEIPEYMTEGDNVYKFYSDACSKSYARKIYPDISTAPLMDYASIAFCALHFAFWTHPKRIYLIGCDCAFNGYFDNTPQDNESEKIIKNNLFFMINTGYQRVKNFRDTYYPDVEIISINPVGLKGLFKDIYTNDNGEYTDECGNVIDMK